MVLNIPPLSQRDSRWSGQRLGVVNSTTIGSHGCVITSMCMIATYYGHPLFPDTLDDILTDRGLYYDGNLYVNNSITKIYPDIKFDKVIFCETTPAPIIEIKNYLDQGKPVVVALINQGIRHYILIIGYEGDKLFANDPWQGDKVSINDRWGDPTSKILQINFFSGTIPTKQTVNNNTPSVSDQTTINLGLELGFMEIGAIRSEILDLRRDKINLEQQVSSLKLNQITPIEEEKIIQLAPISEDQNTVSDKLAPYRSRKFILAVLASLVTILNSTFNLGLSQEQLLTTIVPMLAFIGIEGVADVIERGKKFPIPSYLPVSKKSIN